MAWMDKPEGVVFLEFLGKTIQQEFEILLKGPTDNKGNDLSDIYRGRIKAFREIMHLCPMLKAQLEQDRKTKQEEGA